MRRLNGEGSYFFNAKTKLWRFCVQYKDASGEIHQKRLYSHDKAELKAKVEKFTDKIKNGELSDIKVSEWADKWLRSVVSNSCKRKTQENYATTVRNHIVPKFGKYKLENVTASMLQEYFNQLLLDRSPITVISIRTIFIVFFNAAIDFGYLKSNPAKQTRPPKRPKSTKKALSDAEIEKLIEKMEDGLKVKNISETEHFIKSAYKTAIQLGLETGMREGEIFGLMWSNVNLKKGIIFVRTTLSSARGKAKFDTPKSSHSERQVILAASTIKLLRDWKEQQFKFESKYYGIYVNSNNLVFTNIYGGFVSMTNFSHRFFAPLLKESGITDFSFHGLRHTHASKLLAAGVDVQVVSHRLGHASVSTTMNIYAHLLPDSQEMVRGKIDMIFAKKEN